MIESVDGDTIAAPKPCTARAAMSTPVDPARPQTREATEKMTTPMRNIRLRPRMSPARPPSSRKPPNVIAYAVITHCRPVGEKWRLWPIEGSATLTIETSSTVMKNATQTSASACQRLGSGAAVAVAAAAVIECSSPVVTAIVRRRTAEPPIDFRSAQCRKWRRPVKTIAAPASRDGGDHVLVAA